MTRPPNQGAVVKAGGGRPAPPGPLFFAPPPGRAGAPPRRGGGTAAAGAEGMALDRPAAPGLQSAVRRPPPYKDAADERFPRPPEPPLLPGRLRARRRRLHGPRPVRRGT